jgi:cytochrome c-type biogenesis protein
MFGIDLIDASLGLAMLIALSAGFLSFLSPCVLPVVPPYIAYMAGTTINSPDQRANTNSTIVTAFFFVLGLSSVFLILGLVAASAGQFFQEYQSQLAVVSGLVIIGFGLHFLSVFRIPILNRDARFDAGDQGGTYIGAYVLGLAFAFGWSPCLGPVLGAVLAMVAQESSLGRGLALMAIYAIGLGTPFLLVAAFLGQSVGLLNRIKRHMHRIEQAMGLLLVFVGVMMATGGFTRFAFWLLELFPFLGAIG